MILEKEEDFNNYIYNTVYLDYLDIFKTKSIKTIRRHHLDENDIAIDTFINIPPNSIYNPDTNDMSGYIVKLKFLYNVFNEEFMRNELFLLDEHNEIIEPTKVNIYNVLHSKMSDMIGIINGDYKLLGKLKDDYINSRNCLKIRTHI